MKTILNLRWILFVIVFVLMTLLSISSWIDDLGISIAFLVLGVLLIFGVAIIVPNRYIFSAEGIEVKYCFGLKTFLRWNDIKFIEDRYAGRRYFPWLREYEIGYFETKIMFHERAVLPKNRKTTELIEKYYHKTIEKCG